ncbi:hypothetical protein R3P38DRAFT_2810974 [Favolaschia claudopus]|uniref:Uncharacterized protein n=1 Tax=Favolaschia claudopus TaxID=2862362 RepID=A0AAV9ZAT5_9AGAR
MWQLKSRLDLLILYRIVISDEETWTQTLSPTGKDSVTKVTQVCVNPRSWVTYPSSVCVSGENASGTTYSYMRRQTDQKSDTAKKGGSHAIDIAKSGVVVVCHGHHQLQISIRATLDDLLNDMKPAIKPSVTPAHSDNTIAPARPPARSPSRTRHKRATNASPYDEPRRSAGSSGCLARGSKQLKPGGIGRLEQIGGSSGLAGSSHRSSGSSKSGVETAGARARLPGRQHFIVKL